MTSPASDLLPADLLDEDLQALAADWRRRALQGDKFARGRAHEFEVELRRRQLSGAVPARLVSLQPVATLAEVPDQGGRWRAAAFWGRRKESA